MRSGDAVEHPCEKALARYELTHDKATDELLIKTTRGALRRQRRDMDATACSAKDQRVCLLL